MKSSFRLQSLFVIFLVINLYPQTKSLFFNVLDYGAVNDSSQPATDGINAAI